ncbi:ubiquitin-conjugating enzyme E2 2-like [Rutidosis leptorrhynchoides]|uniref:ubiquitin-conjugating enzyme E2 2-like n=1 Tax=Rutidosis leptorrhynchoides TaxID=125765 RepID=UPI003A996520
MSTSARTRLIRDFETLQYDPPGGITGGPCDNNLMLWNSSIFNPDFTPWHGGMRLTLKFSEDYSYKTPSIQFISKMFHPNIYEDGRIYLGIIESTWTPVYDVAAILTTIQSMLCDPSPYSPANREAARMFIENKWEYDRKVRDIIARSFTADRSCNN